MKILCDFDGTAARNDVGFLLFRTFAGNGCFEIVKQWKEGRISSKECLIRECRMTRVSREELTQFVDAQELMPLFPEFVDFCRKQNIDLEIVSDGLDFYIRRILRNYRLDFLSFHSNRITFLNDHQIQPTFPYDEHSCGHCANCKGYHVREAKKEGHRVIYIGDGLSDRCGARAADIVFAKQDRDLLTFCRENQIPHFEFRDFGDVMQRLGQILDGLNKNGSHSKI